MTTLLALSLMLGAQFGAPDLRQAQVAPSMSRGEGTPYVPSPHQSAVVLEAVFFAEKLIPRVPSAGFLIEF